MLIYELIHFFNPDPYSQISISLNSFKSGGLFGKGPGQGVLKEKLPEAHTDFIFAVVGEEFGFIVCSIIILLFLLIIIRTLLKLLKINNPFIIIAIVGLICSFGLQALINILSSLDLIPTKGNDFTFYQLWRFINAFYCNIDWFSFIINQKKK